MSQKKRRRLQTHAQPAPRRPRRTSRAPLRLVAGLAAVLAGLLLVRGLSGVNPAVGVPREGDRAPELKVRTLAGERLALSDLRGKVVLVNFWATWCPPCRAEMPGFERVWRERQEAGFVVVGLSADETGSGGVARFLREQGITYPVAMASAADRAAYGGVYGLPASFLVNRRGVVERIVTGLYDESLLRRDVSRLLRDPW